MKWLLWSYLMAVSSSACTDSACTEATTAAVVGGAATTEADSSCDATANSINCPACSATDNDRLAPHSDTVTTAASPHRNLTPVEEDDVLEGERHDASSSCGLFMAASSIPGSGWGMYTGRDVERGEVLHPTDVAIVVADYSEQERARERWLRRDMSDTDYLPPNWLLGQYYWIPYVTASDFEAENAMSILPGLGMLANSHAGLVNTDVVGSLNRGVGLEGSDSRGSVHAGAYSHAHEVTSKAVVDLPAGHELFVEYSDQWFAARSEAFGMLPLSTQFDQADSIMKAWKDLVDKRKLEQGANESSSVCKAGTHKQQQQLDPAEHSAEALSSHLLSDLWKDVVLPSITHSSGHSSESSQEDFDDTQRLLSALPKTAARAAEMLSSVPVPDGSPSAYATVNSTVIRSLPWLHENGICLDHLEPGDSILGATAGRGAFARHRLAAGSVVAPAPVVHLSRKHLTTLNLDDSFREDWVGHQLLLNYCYGHASTSLVFFPYSPVVNLINHAPPTVHEGRGGGGRGLTANVALRWSNRTLPSSLQGEWLESWTPNEILGVNDKSHLVMEIYALREIAAGEEIFLDYGDDWHHAWKRHVQEHENAAANAATRNDGGNINDDYVSAWHYEKLKDTEGVIYVESDREHYPPKAWVHVRCYVDPEWIAKELLPDAKGWYTWPEHSNTDMENFEQTSPCRVVQEDGVGDKRADKTKTAYDSQKESITYRVIIPPKITSQEDGNFTTEIKVKGLSRQAIVFSNQPYTTHQFLRRGFRHEIGMPEDMVPLQWRDLLPVPPDAFVPVQRQEQPASRDQEQEIGKASIDKDPSTKTAMTTADGQQQQQQQCGLYMAESAIPNAGLGMYTAKEIPVDHRIFSGDVVVPVEDLHLNLRLRSRYNRGINNDEGEYHEWLLEHYFWNPTHTKANFEAGRVQSIVPGLGMLANSHTGLVNALLSPPRKNDLDMHRSADPGAGAVTAYHDVHYTARGRIEAGSELFVEYGDDWFRHRRDLGYLPLSSDFLQADDIVLDFAESVGYNFSSEFARKLWTETLDSPRRKSSRAGDDEGEDDDDEDHHDDEEEQEETTFAKRLRLLAALPKTVEQVEHVVTNLGGSTARLTVPEQVRSNKWLQEHGMCLDNIEPGRSTISQAGKGAFATRFIKAGDVIAPMPMAHVFRKHMEVYNSEDLDDPEEEVWRDSTQLLLNYCYGHRDSSVLLFPYSPVVNYVNHHSVNHNARLRWTESNPIIAKLHKHAEWFSMTPEELEAENVVAGIVMEMVATRDIRPGEEVFLHYGNRWDQAWRDHLNDWEPDPEESSYASAARVNRMPEMEVLRTERELREHEDGGDDLPFDPSQVMTVCYVPRLHPERDSVARDSLSEPPRYRWKRTAGLFVNTNHAYPCTVIERNEQRGRASSDNGYGLDDGDLIAAKRARADTVRPVPVTYSAVLQDYHGEGRDAIVMDIPRRAIEYFDRQYTSDMFLEGRFRHEIELPDGMVPEAWLDLRAEREGHGDDDQEVNDDYYEQ